MANFSNARPVHTAWDAGQILSAPSGTVSKGLRRRVMALLRMSSMSIAFGRKFSVGALGLGGAVAAISFGGMFSSATAQTITWIGQSAYSDGVGTICMPDNAVAGGVATTYTCTVTNGSKGYGVFSGVGMDSANPGQPDFTQLQQMINDRLGVGAILLGNQSTSAVGQNSVAVGASASATATRATAVGYSSAATGADSISVGDSTSSGVESIAIGRSAAATATNSTAVGGAATTANAAQAQGVRSTALGWGSTAAGTDSIAVGDSTAQANAIAMGRYAYAETNGVAIGLSANANQSGSIAIGQTSYAGVDAIHIGTSNVTGNWSNHTGAFRRGSTLIGDNANSQGLYSTVVGNSNNLLVNQRVLAQGQAIPILTDGKFVAQGAFSNLLGAYNTVGTRGGADTSINPRTYSSVAVTVVGAANNVQDSNGAFVAGYGNTITDSYDDQIDVSGITEALNASGIAGIISDPNTKLGQVGVIGAGNTLNGANSTLIMGMRNNVDGAFQSQVAGFNQEATNVENAFITGADSTVTDSTNVFVAGSNNSVTNASNVLALGDDQTVGSATTTASNSILIGDRITFADTADAQDAVAIGSDTRAASGAVAIGVTAQATGERSIAIGYGALATGSVAMGTGSMAGGGGAAFGDNADAGGTPSSAVPTVTLGTALGNGAVVRTSNGVALGTASVASTAAGVVGYVPTLADAAETAAINATTSTLAAVSVGDAAGGQFRQITGVAAGTVDSDAVNVAQLKAAQAESTTHYYSVNDGGTTTGNYANDGATGASALAAGTDASASGNFSTAVGTGNIALGTNSSAVGSGNYVTSYMAGAFGVGNSVNGEYALAVGSQSNATAEGTTAIGRQANASAVNAIAIGSQSTAFVANAVAIGNASRATVSGSVAIGSGAVAAAAAGVAGYIPAGAGVAATTAVNATTSTLGAVSVGDTTGGQFRQITAVAAGTADSDAVNVAQLKAAQAAATTHYYSVNSTLTGTGSNYANDGATGTNSLAAGVNALAQGNQSSSVGYGNQVVGTGSTNSSVIGSSNIVANSANSIAVGASNSTTNSSVVGILGGSNTVTGATNTAVVGVSNTLTGGSGNGVIGGRNTLIGASDSIQIGNQNSVLNSQSVAQIGGLNSASASIASSMTGISNRMTSVTASSIVGISNTLASTSEGNATGVSNTITGGTQNAIIGSYNSLVNSSRNFVAGFSNSLGTNLSGNQVIATAGTVLSNTTDSVLIGRTGVVAANNTVAIGTLAQALQGQAVAIGSSALANGNQATAINASATGDGSVAIGGVSSGTAFANGFGAVAIAGVAQGDTATALGYQARAEIEGAVALGSSSYAATVAGVTGYVPTGASTTQASAINATTSTLAAVSVGNAASGQFRQITSVAAGTADSDAVNVAQLKAAQDAATTHYYSVNDGGTPSGNYDNDGATGTNALAAGVGAVASADDSIALGASSVSGNRSIAMGTGNSVTADYSYAVGVNNSLTDSFGDYLFASGAENRVSGEENYGVSLLGGQNIVAADANRYAQLFGFDNRLSGSLNSSVQMIGISNELNGDANSDVNVIGARNVLGSVQLTSVIGSDNDISNANTTSVIGARNTLDGGETVAVMGANLGLENISSSLIQGFNMGIFNVSSSVILAEGGSVSSGLAGVVLIGSQGEVSGNNGVAIGTVANAQQEGSVALGSYSVANTAAGVAGYVPTGASVAQTNAINATTSTLGAVSVGDADNREFRQITGVAAGTADSDAVNVAQLNAVATQASAGWNVTAQGANGTNVSTASTTGNAVDLNNADGNIVVSKTAGSNDVTFDLADDVTVNSLTAGPVVIATTGINAGSLVISNVAAGVAGTDAVNVSQLNALGTSTATSLGGGSVYDAATNTVTASLTVGTNTYTNVQDALTQLSSVANAGWTVTDGTSAANIGPNGTVTFTGDSNISVTQTGADDAGEVEIALNPDVDLTPAGSLTVGNTLVNTAGVTVADGTTTTAVTAGGVTSGTVVLSGTTNTVTGLSNTTLTDPSFATAGRAATEEQLAQVNQTASAGWNVTAQGANGTNVSTASTTGNAVDLNNADGNIVVSKTTGSNDVTFDLADDITVDSVTAGNTTVDTNGVSVAGGPNGTVALTGSGLDNGGNTITNVAAGVNATDAVNVSQLQSAIGSVSIGFAGNSGGTITRSSGQVLTIQGEATTAGTYSGGNIRTVTDAATGAVNVQMADSPQFGNVVVNANGSGQITGVTAATLSSTSTDAVNGSQIVALGDSIASSLSPGSTYDPTTNSINTQIVVGGNVYNNVESAIQAVSSSAAAGWNVTTAATGTGVVSGSSTTNVAPGATVQYVAGNNMMVTQTGTSVEYALNPNLTGVQSIAVTGGPTINGDGIDMGGDRITNLAAGVAGTDAVNVNQLNSGMTNILNQANSYTDTAIANVRFDLSEYRRDSNGSTASAMAMATVPQAFEPGMGIMGFGVSHWQGEQAVAVGFSKASDDGRLIVRASGTYNTRRQAGAAVGVGIQF